MDSMFRHHPRFEGGWVTICLEGGLMSEGLFTVTLTHPTLVLDSLFLIELKNILPADAWEEPSLVSYQAL